MSVRATITEATAERMADRMLWARLEADRSYGDAPDAETQSSREDEIGAEVWREIESKYDVA